MKNYVKMNDGKTLSLGNVFNSIKKISVGRSAMQNELFCSLFDVIDVNSTTVNNYCIGIRTIGIEYKKIYTDLYENYKINKTEFLNIIVSLISILDEKIYKKEHDHLSTINNNHNLRKLCVDLIDISKRDDNISKCFVDKVSNYLNSNSLYECIVELLYYSIVENKQPIYKQDINIKINKKELDEYLKIKLYEGSSYITSLGILSNKNNMYACAELGSLYYDGYVNGFCEYDKSYELYMKAADKNHPKACFMVANMILNRKVEYNFDTLWKYLNKSIKLGSCAGLNTMGKCYLNGITKNNKIDINKAKYYFKLSSEQGYVYAFNNLGLLCKNEEEAIKYFKISADMKESWALNRVGEYYRKKGDLKKAYFYYIESNKAPFKERCKWAQYNIDKFCKNMQTKM